MGLTVREVVSEKGSSGVVWVSGVEVVAAGEEAVESAGEDGAAESVSSSLPGGNTVDGNEWNTKDIDKEREKSAMLDHAGFRELRNHVPEVDEGASEETGDASPPALFTPSPTRVRSQSKTA